MDLSVNANDGGYRREKDAGEDRHTDGQNPEGKKRGKDGVSVSASAFDLLPFFAESKVR